MAKIQRLLLIKFCEGSGSQLVEVNSTELNDWLLGLMKFNSIKNVWLGAVGFYNDELTWVPRGRPLMPFRHWFVGEPNNPETENCALLSTSQQVGGWASADCAQKYNYICMRQRYGKYCKVGFLYYKGKCYSFSSDRVDWEVAVEQCNRMRADLAEIDSLELNAWLTSKVQFWRKFNGGVSWIGGSTLYSDGNWAWIVSHRPMLDAYLNWSPSEATTRTKRRGGIIMNGQTGKWETKATDEHFEYICEKPFDTYHD